MLSHIMCLPVRLLTFEFPVHRRLCDFQVLLHHERISQPSPVAKPITKWFLNPSLTAQTFIKIQRHRSASIFLPEFTCFSKLSQTQLFVTKLPWQPTANLPWTRTPARPRTVPGGFGTAPGHDHPPTFPFTASHPPNVHHPGSALRASSSVPRPLCTQTASICMSPTVPGTVFASCLVNRCCLRFTRCGWEAVLHRADFAGWVFSAVGPWETLFRS